MTRSTTQNGKSRQREAFAAALLSGLAIAKAAKSAGISERTAYRWLEDVGFRKFYRRAKADLVARATTRVLRVMDRAAAKMVRIMNDPKVPPFVQLSAATRLYDRGRTEGQLDALTERIEELEESQEQ